MRRPGSSARTSTGFSKDGPCSLSPTRVGYRARTFVRRNRLAVTAAAVFVSCIAGFGLVAALQARALAAQSRIAGLERDKAEQVVRVLVDLFETTNPAVRPDGDRIPIGEFLAGAENRALAQLSGAPLVRAKLQQVFGLIHAERGEFTPARTAFEEALAEQRRLVGPDHPDALESLQALGQAMRGLGDDARARPLLEESLDRHRRVYGDEHEKTARAMVALAPLVAATDLDAERTLLTQALEVRHRVLPPNDPDLALITWARSPNITSDAVNWNARASCIGRHLPCFATPARAVIPRRSV